MKTFILGLTVAAATLAAAGAASAQPYGYRHDDGYRGGYERDYRYDHQRLRDSDRDGVPDRAEWGRDRDRDGRPDQFDRYDNRRHHHRGWDRRHHGRYDGYREGGYRYYR